MKSLNNCTFIGNLGQDPEMKALPNGDPVAQISVGCNWKTKNNEGTEWVRAVAFGKLAEIIRDYLTKGSRVYISGRMQTRKWQDNTGADRYSTEIILNDMMMLDSKGADQAPRSVPQPQEEIEEDDIPFSGEGA